MRFLFKRITHQLKRNTKKRATFCTVIYLEMRSRSSVLPNSTGKANHKKDYSASMVSTFIIESTKREIK
jgi:hypothetical protein